MGLFQKTVVSKRITVKRYTVPPALQRTLRFLDENDHSFLISKDRLLMDIDQSLTTAEAVDLRNAICNAPHITNPIEIQTEENG